MHTIEVNQNCIKPMLVNPAYQCLVLPVMDGPPSKMSPSPDKILQLYLVPLLSELVSAPNSPFSCSPRLGFAIELKQWCLEYLCTFEVTYSSYSPSTPQQVLESGISLKEDDEVTIGEGIFLLFQ